MTRLRVPQGLLDLQTGATVDARATGPWPATLQVEVALGGDTIDTGALHAAGRSALGLALLAAARAVADCGGHPPDAARVEVRYRALRRAEVMVTLETPTSDHDLYATLAEVAAAIRRDCAPNRPREVIDPPAEGNGPCTEKI